jgi:hypothetical protein
MSPTIELTGSVAEATNRDRLSKLGPSGIFFEPNQLFVVSWNKVVTSEFYPRDDSVGGLTNMQWEASKASGQTGIWSVPGAM